MDKKEILDCLQQRLGILTSEFDGVKNWERIDEIGYCIELLQKYDEWIPVTEQMPKEHDSLFMKLRNAKKVSASNFNEVKDSEKAHTSINLPLKYSNWVNVTIEFKDGERRVETSRTRDGKWAIEKKFQEYQGDKWGPAVKVIAWRPLPKIYEGKLND